MIQVKSIKDTMLMDDTADKDEATGDTSIDHN